MSKVLVVEDEETLLRNLADKLKGEGFTVVTAGDGEDGLEKLREEHPDLIILDIMLPKLDGLSLCRLCPVVRPCHRAYSDYHAHRARHGSR